MKKALIRLSLLLIPAFFAYLGYLYKDGLYFLLAIFSLGIVGIFIFPNFLSNFSLNLPKVKSLKFNIKKSTKAQTTKKSRFKRLRIYLLIGIPLLILYTAFFTYVSIFKLEDVNSKNVILDYFISQYQFSSSHFIYYLMGIFILSILVLTLIFKFISKELKRLFKLTLMSFTLSFGGLVIGLCLALLLTFVIGIAQLNYISISSKMGIQNTGVISDTQKLIEKLKSMDNSPEILSYEKGQQNTLLIKLTNNNQNDNSFYINAVISNIPSFLTYPLNVPNKSVFMINNILVVKSINPEEIEPISPYVGKLLVKNYFSSRYIKQYPSVKVMGRQEYLDYRTNQFNETISKIDDYISSVKKQLSNYYAAIQDDKNRIANIQSIIQDSINKKNSQYNSCIKAGYYSFYTGGFYRYYTDSYCSSLASEWDNVINQGNQGIQDLNNEISQLQGYAYVANGYVKDAEDLKVYYESAKDQTPQELGIFEGDKNTIKVAVDETSPNVVVNYFETLTHEYLHYAGYINEDTTFKYSFFEEGLTEYFARKAIKKEFDINTHMGYPLLVAIMTQIVKKIPESTLADIYFKKDETLLEAVLNQAYGEKFYSDSEYFFSILPYANGTEGLKIANGIMLRVGGKEIDESNLYSSGNTKD